MTGTGEVDIRLIATGAGARVLEHTILIEAGAGEVWEAWVTGEGQRRWASPFAEVDLSIDGTMEAGFSPDARLGDPSNVRDRVLAWLPGRMLAWQTTAVPPGAPFDAALWQQMHQVAEFVAVGPERTRVTQSMVGIGEGPGWDAVVAFARGVTAYGLRNLKRSLEVGPIDWAAEGMPSSGQLAAAGQL